MSQSNIFLKLKNDAKALNAFPSKKKEFYIVLFNASQNYLSQARVRITGPPQIRLLIKSEWFGGVASGRHKSRLFSIIPKEEGFFQLTATLTSKTGVIFNLPIELRVGNTAINQKTPEPSITSEASKKTKKVNCPYCHELIDADATFCPQCGSNIQQKIEIPKEIVKDKKICIKCGAELPPDAKFCAKCGTKLN